MWFVNKSSETIDLLIMEQKKWIKFEPGVPVDLERDIGIAYINKHRDIVICKNPETYFSNTKMSQLIIRDAGIGDLLLLEPIIRTLNEKQNRNLSLLTMHPDVLKGNPALTTIFKQTIKDDLKASRSNIFHSIEDMRNYSETHPRRHKMHRTDIYNERFGLDIKDKEPRIFFDIDDKPLLVKKKGLTYIGVCLDASHGYRTIADGDGIIKAILENKKNVVVLFGAKKDYGDIQNTRLIDLQGKTTVREAMNYIRCLDKMFSMDTGLMHIALSLHIPTLGFFSIITAEYRMKYFTGPYKVIKKNIPCIGCGDFHMTLCSQGAKKGEAPCQQIPPEDVVKDLNALPMAGVVREFKAGKPLVETTINPSLEKKLTMPIIVQDEEKNLPRFIENVIKHPNIGRVIAIDGGSKDNTVKMLKQAGAEVYIHPYLKDYHDMQAMQRNISCSYVKDGEKILIMDIDECFSKELSDYLPMLAQSNITYGLISRRTFNYYKDITDISKRIKDYPDWQPRFYTWDRKYKFVGGAHHVTLNTPQPTNIQKDIIHFEQEGKDRGKIEAQWAKMMMGVKKYA